MQQGLLCLRLQDSEHLDLAELDTLSARPIADGHFQQGRDSAFHMLAEPSQNLFRCHSTQARAPDGLSRNLPTRCRAVGDAGEPQL